MKKKKTQNPETLNKPNRKSHEAIRFRLKIEPWG